MAVSAFGRSGFRKLRPGDGCPAFDPVTGRTLALWRGAVCRGSLAPSREILRRVVTA